MKAPIAFAGRLEADERARWLAALTAALPGERIVPIEAFAAQGVQPADVQVAIVANPDTSTLAALRNLQWVQSLWAGVEQLLRDDSLADIPIVRMIDPSMSRCMAEAALAWTMYLHRDMPRYARQQRDRVWLPHPVLRAAQRSVGVLGLGALGGAAAQLLAGAGFHTLGWSRTPRTLADVQTLSGADGLQQVLAASDILVCLLPLTDATRHLLDAGVLAHCRGGAGIMNFGRGPLIVTSDLLAALDSGQLGHAVLDVFDTEPLPADSPLWSHPSVTVLPHMSAPTDFASASRIVADNVRAWRESGVVPAAASRARGY